MDGGFQDSQVPILESRIAGLQTENSALQSQLETYRRDEAIRNLLPASQMIAQLQETNSKLEQQLGLYQAKYGSLTPELKPQG